MKSIGAEGADVEPDGLDAVEVAFATSANAQTSKITTRVWLPVALPLVGAIAGALVTVVIGSLGGDPVWVLLLLPYEALIGALAGALLGGTAALVVFRVLRSKKP